MNTPNFHFLFDPGLQKVCWKTLRPHLSALLLHIRAYSERAQILTLHFVVGLEQAHSVSKFRYLDGREGNSENPPILRSAPY